MDEFVLSTSVGWSAERVERLFSASGATVTTVHPCSARVLEDQPVRYLRAGHAVLQDPATLEDQAAACWVPHRPVRALVRRSWFSTTQRGR